MVGLSTPIVKADSGREMDCCLGGEGKSESVIPDYRVEQML